MFLVGDKDEQEFVLEISRASERIIGLLAPVLLERRLLSLIKSRWHNSKTRGGTVFDELFSTSGELGNHDTRLRVGLAMRLYSSEAFEEMRYITKIRNAFAHQLQAKDFQSPYVRDLMPHLKMVDRFPPPVKMKTSEDLWEAFMSASIVEDLSSPKNRFLRTIEVFSFLLFREEHEPAKSEPYF
jgi:DNA-binding MltR family transcriptional regulator